MTFEPQSIKVLFQNKHINLLDLGYIMPVSAKMAGNRLKMDANLL